jgi:hypothetical protein
MRLVVALLLLLSTSATAQTPAPPPGDPAPPHVVAQLHRDLAQALRRFEQMDVDGVLVHVSDRYRTGPLTKPALRQQLLTMFATNERVSAIVRIDEVRMIGDRAWVYSTGEVTGRLRFVGTDVTLFSWATSPEVAHLENGRWRLIGDQQG